MICKKRTLPMHAFTNGMRARIEAQTGPEHGKTGARRITNGPESEEGKD